MEGKNFIAVVFFISREQKLLTYSLFVILVWNTDSNGIDTL